MSRIVRREVRRPGAAHRVVRLVLVLFNLAMLAWLLSYWWDFAGLETQSDAEAAGAAIGTMIGTAFLVFIWLAGDVVLGLFALLTRGPVEVIEERLD